MKVKDLIKLLETVPQELPVEVATKSTYFGEVQRVLIHSTSIELETDED